MNDRRTGVSIVYPRDIVHATGDEEHAVGRPCHVVDLGPHGAEHMLHSPGFLIVQSIITEGAALGMFRGNPEQDVAVVSCAAKDIACGIDEHAAVSRSDVEVPRGHHRTTFTVWVCLTNVERYVTERESPCDSTFQS